MKVFLDTNILISAILFPKGVAAQAYRKAVSDPNQGIICDYSVDEMTLVFRRKFPHRISEMNNFLVTALTTLQLVNTPEEDAVEVPELRDRKDLPILRASVIANADVILTGDKDFTESGITHPKVITPSAFLAL